MTLPSPLRCAMSACLAGAAAFGAAPLPAQTETATGGIIGQVMLFAGDFCPKGWLAANGLRMSIRDNVDLYSVIGTGYLGASDDDPLVFALPDLRDAVPSLSGDGAGTTQMRWCIAVEGTYPVRRNTE